MSFFFLQLLISRPTFLPYDSAIFSAIDGMLIHTAGEREEAIEDT